MTRLDIHPEHLIDRVLCGAANPAERAELALHVRACPACTAEWRLAQALSPVAALADENEAPPRSAGPVRPTDDADESTTAAVDAALAELTRDGRLVAAPQAQHAGAPIAARAWLPWAAALCLFFTGSAAAATLIMAVRSKSSASQPALRAAERERAKRGRSAGGSKAASAAAAPEPITAATPDVAVNPGGLPEPAPAARIHRAPSAPGGASSVPLRGGASFKPVQNAAELFAQARAAAMQGDYARAAALYATLEQRFATSPQAHVSQVVLGRLYLEQLADPRAALAHFDAYLVDGGPNRPEALLGRARALRALNRVTEEIATLRQLVDAYPESLYVVPAQERLRAVK